MSESFVYEDPSTGILTEQTISYSPGIAAGPGRSAGFALKATGGGGPGIYLAEPYAHDDAVLAQPWRGANGVPCGRLNVIETAASTSIVVKSPEDVTFIKNAPILIADDIDVADGLDGTTADYEWRMVTTASYTTTTTYTGKTWTLGLAATTNTYTAGAIVIQPTVGKSRMSAMGVGADGTRQRGLRWNLEKADAPTLTVGTSTSTTITVTVAKPSDNVMFAQHARIYLFTSAAAALRGPLPNQRYDKLVNFNGTTTVTSGTMNTYGGGATYGGGSLVTATRYWLVATVSEDNTDWPLKESKPSAVITDSTV